MRPIRAGAKKFTAGCPSLAVPFRFSNLAICNAWFSGGVEWNISLIGHSPFTARPLFAAELMTDDEVPVLGMYEFERLREAVYQMDFWLGEQDRF